MDLINEREIVELMPWAQRHFLMTRFFLSMGFFFVVAPIALAGQNKPDVSRSWSGILVSSACNADEAFNESPDCTKELPGAKLALYDDTTRVIYSIEPQSSITAHLGDAVTLRGTLDGETVQMTAIESMSIGIPVGQKVPQFSLRDQFGQTQTLDSLKGPQGTVLLFFRSADW
jgi:hypothetical protein